jgi:hypothetical protein
LKPLEKSFGFFPREDHREITLRTQTLDEYSPDVEEKNAGEDEHSPREDEAWRR